MSIRLNGSTSGYTEIDAPAVAGSNTLVLPGGNGSAQQVLATNGSGALSWSNRPILQVVSANYSTQVSTSSSTYTDTGLSASITPSSASNKILLLIFHGTITKDTGSTQSRLFMQLLRGSTVVTELANSLLYTNSSLEFRSSAHFTYLDSPATTSSITYKTQFNNAANRGTIFMQLNNALSTMTLLEVAA